MANWEWTLVGALSVLLLYRVYRRLQLSLAKQPGLVGHVKLAKRLAKRIPLYEFKGDSFFNADGAVPELASRRAQGFHNLSSRLRFNDATLERHAWELKNHLSDSRFTGLYRVPLQFRHMVSTHLAVNPFVVKSEGVRVWGSDGRRYIDVTGSYGTNLLGYDAYKTFLADACEKGQSLGPVLGHYHPVILDNVKRLCAVSNMDEVSFHMSGTEAVMQAVRLAQYHTGKKRIVRFAGAYHGWWGEVQPGIGNPVNAQHTLTLREASERTLTVLRTRTDIACVLVNPLQAMHVNGNAPSDSALISGKRNADYNKSNYQHWLKQLREVCSARGIALIFDEVFMGFRLGQGGAQAYFAIQADLVTYGKTLGGGLPVGVLCGKQSWMARFKPERPADICFARGTFNGHPHVMLAMNAFLRHFEQARLPEGDALDSLWNSRAQVLNTRLKALGLPVQVRNMVSVWTVIYDKPSRYHWMFQYYLRDAGVLLSWVGSGRLIFSHNFSDTDFADFTEQFVRAAQNMQADGWWEAGQHAVTAKHIRNALIREFIQAGLKGLLPRPRFDVVPNGNKAGEQQA